MHRRTFNAVVHLVNSRREFYYTISAMPATDVQWKCRWHVYGGDGGGGSGGG